MSNALVFRIKDSSMQIAYLFANFMCQNDKNARAGHAARRYGFFFPLNMQSSVVVIVVSVTIELGRYFDRKHYSVTFQFSVIRLNILN